jgi:hypothetical protein
MRQTITIKLKPYLQEFLQCKLGDQAAEGSRRNLVGAILTPLIEYAPNDYKFEKLEGPEYFTLEIPQSLGKETRYGVICMSESNQVMFERILKHYFNDIFFQYVEDKIRYSREKYGLPQIKECILAFCADYNISHNEINYEMLKKKYYRRKKNLTLQAKKAKKITGNLSLSSPLIYAL